MLKLISLLVVIMSVQVFSQSTAEDEVTRLKKQLQETEERLRRSELINKETIRYCERLRYQMISMDLAGKSTKVYDKELAGLLALQSYWFNVSYGGYRSESCLFHALTEALNRFSYQFKSESLF